MNMIWGIILIVLVLISWVGQIITAISPKAAAKLGVCEAEAEVDNTFFVDQRAEAVWDSFTCWPLLVAGILLLLNIKIWAYFGMVGGSIFFNFSGRGIITRIAMQRKGIPIGNSKSLAVNHLFMTLWLVMSIITIIMAVKALP
ncbi:MAG: hypothetical protein KAT05_08890 [Spirochaetes bacterium]|nr:hypothetical protein [Spirochaetota bacterium]